MTTALVLKCQRHLCTGHHFATVVFAHSIVCVHKEHASAHSDCPCCIEQGFLNHVLLQVYSVTQCSEGQSGEIEMD